MRVNVVLRHASGRGLRALAGTDDDPGAHRDANTYGYTPDSETERLTGITRADGETNNA